MLVMMVNCGIYKSFFKRHIKLYAKKCNKTEWQCLYKIRFAFGNLCKIILFPSCFRNSIFISNLSNIWCVEWNNFSYSLLQFFNFFHQRIEL